MFKDYAHEYFENGFWVIPATGKIPVIKNWTNIEINEKLIDQWCEKYPNHNIGLLTGKKSGVIAVDIDKDSSLKLVPLSPVVRKGKKGEVRFFKYNGEKNFKRHDLGIELLSDGNQVILPPSIHPETKKPYVWLRGSLTEELPDLDMQVMPKRKTDNVNSFEGRHNTLVKFCGGKISDGLDPTTAIQELIEYDELNHDPPYFTDKTEPHGGGGYNVAFNLYASVAKTSQQRGDYIAPTKSKVEIGSIENYKKSFVKLPKLEGIGQIIFNDLYDHSPIPRTQLCFMSTMNLLSIIIGNKIFNRGTACNLYQYGIAPSGYGKDFSFKRSKQMLIEAGLEKLIGPTSPTSESLVLASLEKSREKVFFINEAESILKRITDDRKNNGLRECLTDLYDYGGKMHTAKEIMSINKTANKKTEDIGNVFSPFLNILMTSTVTAFENYASQDVFSTGFGSRFLFYFEDRFKDENFIENYSPPISEQMRICLKLIAETGKPKIDLTDQSTNFKLNHLKISKRADKTYRDIFEAIKEEKRKYSESNFLSIISRKLYFINKFSTIHHVMINPDNFIEKELSSKSYQWAKSAVDSIIQNMIQNLDSSVSNSPYGKKIKKFEKYLKGRTAKNQGTNKQVLGQRFGSDIPVDERNKIIRDLVEQGTIYAKGNEYFYSASSVK